MYSECPKSGLVRISCSTYRLKNNFFHSQIFSDANSVWKVNVPRLVQSWNRFILQQIYTQSSTYDKNGIDENASQGTVGIGNQD